MSFTDASHEYHTDPRRTICRYGDADAIRVLPKKVEIKFEPITVDDQFRESDGAAREGF